jgi:hypothetical protein
MILYVNGDSHSEGHDAGGPDFAYGRYVADALNAEYVCDAVAGCGNDSIIDRTLKYLESNTPDLIVIGWSTWEREAWFWNGQPYNFTSSGTDSVHPMLQEFYKEWVIDSVKPYVQRQRERDAHTKIYLFHKLLQSKNINHLFFNSYSFFFYNLQYNDPKYYWGDNNINYVHPYDLKMTYYEWLKNQGFKPVTPEFYHYGADAHEAWADFLLPKIKSIIDNN